jgi:hypothetical protein
VNYGDWTKADSEAADREGWNLFTSAGSVHGPFTIQKDDEMAVFASDDDAMRHIRSKMDEGSELHIKVVEILKSINPAEYKYFTEVTR